MTARPLIVNGELHCPKRLGATMARDACVKDQARCGLGCGVNCPIGVAALREAADALEGLNYSEQVREDRRKRDPAYKPGARKRWGAAYQPTGRPRGRPRGTRDPIPGGTGPRSAAR